MKRTILSTTFTHLEVAAFHNLVKLLDKNPDASVILRSEPARSLRQKFLKLRKKYEASGGK